MTGDDRSASQSDEGLPASGEASGDGEVLATGSGPRRRGTRRTFITVAVASAVALTVGGVAIAASSPSPKPAENGLQVPDHGPLGKLIGPHGLLGIGGPVGPLGIVGPDLLGLALGGATLHGEITVAKPGGGNQILDIQRGSVVSASTSALTVKSTDGFTKTYAVTADTLVDAGRDGVTSLKGGHRVSLVATVSGQTATVTRVIDGTLVAKYARSFDPGRLLYRLRDKLEKRFGGLVNSSNTGALFQS